MFGLFAALISNTSENAKIFFAQFIESSAHCYY